MSNERSEEDISTVDEMRAELKKKKKSKEITHNTI